MVYDDWDDSPIASFPEEDFVEDYKLQAKLRYQRRKKHSNLYSKQKKSRKNKLNYDVDYEYWFL